MQGQVYPPPPNLPRRVPELGNALSSVVFVNYQTSRRRDDQDRAVLRTSAGVVRARQVNSRHGAQRPHCVAGHVRFELRNVAANYLFEKSHKFPGIQPNSGDRDLHRNQGFHL